jgi:hypothetical protein
LAARDVNGSRDAVRSCSHLIVSSSGWCGGEE